MSPDETLADALSRDADDPADDAYAGDAVDDADRQAPAPLGPVIDRRDPRVALAVAGIADRGPRRRARRARHRPGPLTLRR
jgi:hypothetical protein